MHVTCVSCVSKSWPLTCAAKDHEDEDEERRGDRRYIFGLAVRKLVRFYRSMNNRARRTCVYVCTCYEWRELPLISRALGWKQTMIIYMSVTTCLRDKIACRAFAT